MVAKPKIDEKFDTWRDVVRELFSYRETTPNIPAFSGFQITGCFVI